MTTRTAATAAAVAATACAIVWTGWHRETPPVVLAAVAMERTGVTTVTGDGVWLYSRGTFSADLDLPLGHALIAIIAKGAPAFDVWPRLRVTLNDRIVAEWDIASTAPQLYWTAVFVPHGANRLVLRFMNDVNDPQAGQDRNVHVERVRVVHGRRAARLFRLSPPQIERSLAALP